MTTVYWWLLQSTLTIAVLAAIVALLCRWLRTRPAVQHALWLVVLAKFMTPPVVVWPWPLPRIADSLRPAQLTGRDGVFGHSAMGTRELFVADAGHGVHESELASALAADVVSEPRPLHASDLAVLESLEEPTGVREWRTDDLPGEGDWWPTDGFRGVINAVPLDLPDESIFEPLQAAARPIAARAGLGYLSAVMLAVWFLGGLAAGATLYRRIVRHWQLVRRATEAPAHLTTEVARLAEAIGVRPMSALVVQGIASPVVWCVGCLRLLWPEWLADDAAVRRCRGVIAHELAHVRRRDHWVAWVELLASLVWWWNPLFWLVRRQLRDTSELACDALALSVLPNDRRRYVEAFLELSSIGNAWAPAPVLGMNTGARRTFERRFNMMLSENTRSKIAPSGLLGVGLLALVTLPSWSLGQVQSPGDSSSTPASKGNVDAATSDPVENSDPSPAANDSERSQEPVPGTQDSPSPPSRRDAVRAEAPDRKVVAVVVGDSGRVAMQDAQTGQDLRMIVVADERLVGLAFSPDGKYLAGLSGSSTISLVEPDTGKRMWTSEIGVREGLRHLRFSPDGKSLFAARGNDSSAEAWQFNAATGEIVRKPDNRDVKTGSGSQRKGSGPGVSRASKLDVIPKDDIEGRVRKLEETMDAILQELRSLRGQTSPDAPTTVEPNSPATRSDSPPARDRSGLYPPAPAIEAIPRADRAVSPDGKTVAVVGDGGVVTLRDLATDFELRRLEIAGNKRVLGLVYSADGTLLRVLTATGKIWEFDAATGKPVRESTAEKPVPADGERPKPRSSSVAADKLTLRADKGELKVFTLKYAAADQFMETLRGFIPGNVKIGSDVRTNSLVVGGPADQILMVEALIRQIDVPADSAGGPTLSHDPTPRSDQGPPSRTGKVTPPPNSAVSQFDLVSLGTATIEARGALRLAQAQHVRLKKLGAAAAVSQEDMETAEINFETARHKLDLLTSIARSAHNSANAELLAARAALEHGRKMVDKGYMTPSQAQVDQAQAQIIAGEAKLKLLDSILNPSTPAASDARPETKP